MIPQSIIDNIKSQTTYNEEDSEYKKEMAKRSVPRFIQVAGTFPAIFKEVNERLSDGYSIDPLHAANLQKAGYLQLAMKKPQKLLETEQAAAATLAERHYVEGLKHLEDHLIAEAVQTILNDDRDAEIQRLRAEAEARKRAYLLR